MKQQPHAVGLVGPGRHGWVGSVQLLFGEPLLSSGCRSWLLAAAGPHSQGLGAS